MGRNRVRRGRLVHGFFILNKPLGMSSNAALQKVKRIFGARKAGHTGSLDPLATGLLPICLGEATKLSSYLLDADKRYHVKATLGVTTTTGDAEGEVIDRRDVGDISEARLQEVFSHFVGDIKQVPPMYSALKRDGQTLYKLARQGIVVEREPRPVTIRSIELLGIDGCEIEFDVVCSKGTYIRTLAEDIGNELGCGAFVSMLHRTGAGRFVAGDMLTFDDLESLQGDDQAVSEACFERRDASLEPLECALIDWPEVKLSNESVFYLKRGQAVTISKQVSTTSTAGWVKLYDDENGFFGLGQILDNGRLAPKKLFQGL